MAAAAQTPEQLAEALKAAELHQHTVAGKVPRSPQPPTPGHRNILITSALPYCNNTPHLGNLIGAVLSADVYARYCRLRGYNCIYVCGTDEYGTATETRAMAENMTPQEICAKYYKLHKEIYEWFDIDFDHFGRTSTPKQTEIAQHIFKRLYDNGNVFEDSLNQWYCENCKRFLADRYVEGTCPNCKADARGDQCDACCRPLNAIELIDPRCKVCSQRPVERTTKHLFIDLPKLKPELEEFVAKSSKKGDWSDNSTSMTLGFLKEVKPRCITRDLKWGTPVPLAGYENKVFYVWFDAPIGYLSITMNLTDDWRAWWLNPENVELVQFMGKDNVPFHTIIFPATLLGTKEPFTMLHHISTCEYLNYEAGKFSKSKSQGVFGDDAKHTGIPAEVWRYYLLVNRPEISDTVFLWSDLAQKNNTELLNNLGNFVNRALKFIVDRLDGIIPVCAPAAELADADRALIANVNAKAREYCDALENVHLKSGLKCCMDISALGNEYLQSQKPWDLLKTDIARCRTVLHIAAQLVYYLTALLNPYMPAFSDRVLEQLQANLPAPLSETFEFRLEAGHRLGPVTPLFRRITEQEIAAFRERFAGKKEIVGADAATAATAAAPRAGGAAATAKAEPAKPAPADTPDVARLDMRVGHILSVKKHPNADSLYIEQIDIGREKPVNVCSGLVGKVPMEKLQGAHVVMLCNIKPTKMRGEVSEAMVLCAANADDSVVEFVAAPAGAKAGDRVAVKGMEMYPEAVLNPKKKTWENAQPDLRVDAAHVACYKGTPLVVVGDRPCTVDTLVDALIR